MSLKLGWVPVILLCCAGCATFQDSEYCVAQRLRAHHAWCCCEEYRCSQNPFSHYSCGWRKGYADVLMGSDGQCPAVPPQKYWSHKYQTAEGECAVNDWFEGYQDGANAAVILCQGTMHSVPVSESFRQCSPGCLPTDPSPYPFGKTTLGSTLSERIEASPAKVEQPLDVPPVPTAPDAADPASPQPAPPALRDQIDSKPAGAADASSSEETLSSASALDTGRHLAASDTNAVWGKWRNLNSASWKTQRKGSR